MVADITDRKLAEATLADVSRRLIEAQGRSATGWGADEGED